MTNLYEGFLQRGPDAGGLAWWTGEAGTTAQSRQHALGAFAACEPFKELAGTLSRETYWLVTDQLGTPRMVADKSGSLVGIKRHDYLPFGEELFAGTGGRTPTQGYSAGDNVRQQFTGKERDNETTLNYLQARYYSNVQGRFTSVDPRNFQAMRDLSDLQSWNAYAYVNNNPLRRVDPDGKGFSEKLGNLVKGYGWASNKEVEAELERRRAWLNEHYFEQDAEGNWHPFNAHNLSQSEVWTTYDIVQDEMYRYPMHQITDEDLLGIAAGTGGGGNTGGSSKFPPKPKTPPGTSIKEFGHDVMKWGTGDAEARSRIATLTKDELQNAGVTREIAEAWRDFYLKVKDATPSNPSAAGRAELMQRALDLLK